MRIWSLILVLCLCGCSSLLINPFTTVPALVLGAYDKSQKRWQWHDYAQKGDVYAQYELAMSYCCSMTEGEHDYQKSLKWFCSAGNNGYLRAQLALGKLYEGREKLGNLHIPIDKARAYMWYQLASNRVSSQAIELRKNLEQTAPKNIIADGKYLASISKQVPCDNLPLEWAN